jgi:hypothetical protein
MIMDVGFKGIWSHINKALLDDASLLLSPRIAMRETINKSTLFSEHSEWHVQKAYLKQQLVSTKKDSEPAYVGVSEPGVVFINGILTPMVVAEHQRERLSVLVGESVGLIYNPTESLLADLWECHTGRYGYMSEMAMFTVKTLIDILSRTQGEILLIGYSQGAILASAALQYMISELAIAGMERIKYVTFGPGFKDSVLPHFISQEHFANARDPITHLGLLHPEHQVTGHVYQRDAHGHLLVADYLNPMMELGFGGHSAFEKRVFTKAGHLV